MHADAECDPCVFWQIPIGFSYSLLDLNRGPQRTHGAAELGQHTVSDQLHQTAPVSSQRRFQSFAAMHLKALQRPALVAAHQPGVADDVRRQDRGQPSLLTRQ